MLDNKIYQNWIIIGFGNTPASQTESSLKSLLPNIDLNI